MRECLERNFFVPPNISEIVSKDLFLSTLPNKEVTPVVGGVAHEVYRIYSEGKSYYLKKRGERFAQIPEITCNPNDIVFEKAAFSVFEQILPESFPKVLSFSKDKAYIVTSDAVQDGAMLEKLFLEKKVTDGMLSGLGNALKRIHLLSATCAINIRGDKEGEFYAKKLQHRFGYKKNPILDNLIDELKKSESQLILGDPAPKNIAVSKEGNSFMFFDLEDVHQGNIIFDYGYLLGHIILHSLTPEDNIMKKIDLFANGYGSNNFNESTLKMIALGTVLYRLESIIPYSLKFSDRVKQSLIKEIENNLLKERKNTSWIQITQSLKEKHE